MNETVDLFLVSGNAVVSLWIGVFALTAILLLASRTIVYVKAMKIQRRPVRWAMLRHELFWSAFNVFVTTTLLTLLSNWLASSGYLLIDTRPAAWYVVLFEFALYFVIFDLYFYGVHRLIHTEPFYRWVHHTHHKSTVPNPVSYASMTPIEGTLEGLIIPLFLTVFTVHETSTYLILPFASLMGLYVHCGYEFAPHWWYRKTFTKWLITPMYHDQHHQFFNCNYGAYTTIWDRLFGTLRPRFEKDFLRHKAGGRTAAEREAV